MEHGVDNICVRIRALPLCHVNISAIRALAMAIGNQPPFANLSRDERKNGSSKHSRTAVTLPPTQGGWRQTRTTTSPKAIDVITMVAVTAKP
jgi:hypothetical protein